MVVLVVVSVVVLSVEVEFVRCFNDGGGTTWGLLPPGVAVEDAAAPPGDLGLAPP